MLQRLIKELRPVVSLEVGLAYGISALYICEALREVGAKRHIVIDPNQQNHWQNIGLHNIQAAGYADLAEHISHGSELALPQLLRDRVEIEFAFIDGYHIYDQTLVEFYYIDRLLKPGGIVVFDDADWPSVRKVCRYVATNRAYSVHRCLEHKGQARCLPPKSTFSGQVVKQLPLLDRFLKPEWANPDSGLGLLPKSRCVAFKKTGTDDRHWEFHREF